MVQLPAVNTPQFNWCRTRLPRHPEPVPPIYQPEVAARAIVHAAYHWRREWCVGASTLMAVWGSKFIPGALDRYLAGQRAWEGQETEQAVPPGRPDNLFEPLPGDYGAHGIFDDRARSSSWQWWLSAHRRTLLTAVTTAAAAAGLSFATTLLKRPKRSAPASRTLRGPAGTVKKMLFGGRHATNGIAAPSKRETPLRVVHRK